MSFHITSLPREQFLTLFTLDDDSLAALGAKRYTADKTPGFPCRVSLRDAEIGEQLILVPFRHQDTASPYQASGPIFVRAAAQDAAIAPGEVPALLRSRLLSVRAYDASDLMTEADVVDGRDLETRIGRLFEDPRVRYLHVHFAKPGCYACRVERTPRPTP